MRFHSLFILLVAALHPVRAFCGTTSETTTLRSFLATKPSFKVKSSVTTPIGPPNVFSKHDVGVGRHSSLITVRGGASAEEFASQAYDWAVNLGAPAALVAGAVVATLYENLRTGALDIEKKDSNYARFAKKGTTVLLFSAFALQMISIFVTTVTGTMLLSKDFSKVVTTATTPLAFLREQFEFEYLTSRLSFLQGLLHWLGGVALEHTIPRPLEGIAALKMNRFVASSTFTLIFLLFSFYNNHLTFYNNYFAMTSRWFNVTTKRFLFQWPPRPLAIVFVPSMLFTIYSAIQAFRVYRDEESKYE